MFDGNTDVSVGGGGDDDDDGGGGDVEAIQHSLLAAVAAALEGPVRERILERRCVGVMIGGAKDVVAGALAPRLRAGMILRGSDGGCGAGDGKRGGGERGEYF